MSNYGSVLFVGIAFVCCFLPLPAIPFPSFRQVLLTPNTGGTGEDDDRTGCSSLSLAGCCGDSGEAGGAVGFAERPGSFSGSIFIGYSSLSLAAAGGADEDEAGGGCN